MLEIHVAERRERARARLNAVRMRFQVCTASGWLPSWKYAVAEIDEVPRIARPHPAPGASSTLSGSVAFADAPVEVGDPREHLLVARGARLEVR